MPYMSRLIGVDIGVLDHSLCQISSDGRRRLIDGREHGGGVLGSVEKYVEVPCASDLYRANRCRYFEAFENLSRDLTWVSLDDPC